MVLLPILVAQTGGTIVLELILSTHSYHVGNGGSGTELQLPRGGHLIVAQGDSIDIVLYSLGALKLLQLWLAKVVSEFIIHLSGIFLGEGVPHRCVDGSTDAERRICYGAEDGTQLEVHASTFEPVVVFQFVEAAVRAVVDILCIVGVHAIVHIVDAHGETQVEAILDVERKVQVVRLQSTYLTADVTVGLSVPSHRALILIDAYQLRADTHHAQIGVVIDVIRILQSLHIAIVIDIVYLARREETHHIGHLLCLRSCPTAAITISITKTSKILLHRKGAVEVLRLMVVEPEVHEAQIGGSAYLVRIDKAQLIPRPARLIAVVCAALGLRIVEPEGGGNLIAAIEAYASRVGIHRRDICTQGTHSTTHTHETCRSVEFRSSETSRLVLCLGHCACAKQGKGR